jgi:hypothetical protein
MNHSYQLFSAKKYTSDFQNKKETGKNFWEVKHSWNFRKVFLMTADIEKNKIRECWQLVTKISEYEFFYIYIDTQTGDIIRQYRKWVMM